MSPEPGPDTARPSRFTPADLGMLLLLALVCLVLRLPTLDRVALNPDESQYSSSAAYLAANGESAYAFPYGTPWTMTLYKGMTVLFGPYPMPEVRILVLLLALGAAWILYDWVRGEAGRGWGVVAGLLFLCANQAFEGWTANREWFSFFPALLGIWLAMRAVRRDGADRWPVWLLAGLACGASIWFKRQAVFLTLVVPVWLVWLAWVERAVRDRLRQLVPFAAGGLIAGAIFVAPFLIHGTAGVYVFSLVRDYSGFVAENAAQTRALAGGAAGLILGQMYWFLPHRALFLVAYFWAAVLLIGAVMRGLGRPSRALPAERAGIVLMAVYLVAALACVRLGDRFLGHYFLYALAPLAGAVALVPATLGRAADRTGRILALALGVAFLVDRAFALGHNSWTAYREAWPASAPFVVYGVVAAAIVVFVARRPWPRAGTLLVALVLLETAMVATLEVRRPVPPSFPYHPDRFAQLAEKVRADAHPGDRIFVWGWLPEVYSATRLEPASHMTITQYVVEDYTVAPGRVAIEPKAAGLLMDDLRRREPRFIVDASRRSWTLVADGKPWVYDLRRYPDFELVRLLRERYRRVGTFSDCDLYERR